MYKLNVALLRHLTIARELPLYLCIRRAYGTPGIAKVHIGTYRLMTEQSFILFDP